MDYKLKYFKYKIKYLNLKNKQRGGVSGIFGFNQNNNQYSNQNNNQITNQDEYYSNYNLNSEEKVKVKIYTTGLADSESGNLLHNNTTKVTYEKIMNRILENHPNLIITDIFHYDSEFNDTDVDNLNIIDNQLRYVNETTILPEFETHVIKRYIDKNDIIDIKNDNHILIDLAHLFENYRINKLIKIVCYENFSDIVQKRTEHNNNIRSIIDAAKDRWNEGNNDINFFESVEGKIQASENQVNYIGDEWTKLTKLKEDYKQIDEQYNELMTKYEYDESCVINSLNTIYIDWSTAKDRNDNGENYRDVENFIKIHQGKIIQDESIKDRMYQLSNRIFN
jgi:hypothetical protein